MIKATGRQPVLWSLLAVFIFVSILLITTHSLWLDSFLGKYHQAKHEFVREHGANLNAARTVLSGTLVERCVTVNIDIGHCVLPFTPEFWMHPEWEEGEVDSNRLNFDFGSWWRVLRGTQN